jgi:hypothetical protein
MCWAKTLQADPDRLGRPPPERPIYQPTPNQAPLLPDACAATLEVTKHRPTLRSDPVSPHVRVALRVVASGAVTTEPDFTPGARV